MKSIKTEEFFKQLAVDSGMSDLRVVRDVFYGMIRTISRELRNKGTIKLPDWGEFYLKIHSARRHKSITGEVGMVQARPTVKFSPDIKVKKYFYELGEKGL